MLHSWRRTELSVKVGRALGGELSRGQKALGMVRRGNWVLGTWEDGCRV